MHAADSSYVPRPQLVPPERSQTPPTLVPTSWTGWKNCAGTSGGLDLCQISSESKNKYKALAEAEEDEEVSSLKAKHDQNKSERKQTDYCENKGRTWLNLLQYPLREHIFKNKSRSSGTFNSSLMTMEMRIRVQYQSDYKGSYAILHP